MRVIAGSAGGRRLEVPRQGVRPTMDRVKAAIFSSLGGKVTGARILDLFAGSGGLGIEALSRGAASALFIESNWQAASVIRTNLALTQLKAQVHTRDVFVFLAKARGPFDIIFADPPYERSSLGQSFTELLLHNPALPHLLARQGVFVLEKRPQEQLPPHPQWVLTRARKYGATQVLFFMHAS